MYGSMRSASARVPKDRGKNSYHELKAASVGPKLLHDDLAPPAIVAEGLHGGFAPLATRGPVAEDTRDGVVAVRERIGLDDDALTGDALDREAPSIDLGPDALYDDSIPDVLRHFFATTQGRTRRTRRPSVAPPILGGWTPAWGERSRPQVTHRRVRVRKVFVPPISSTWSGGRKVRTDARIYFGTPQTRDAFVTHRAHFGTNREFAEWHKRTSRGRGGARISNHG